MGENHFAPVPVAVYGVVLALCAAAYFILVVMLHRLHGNDTIFARAAGTDRKEKISVVLYIAAIPLTFVNQWISVALYVLVAMIWFVPDKRFERRSKNRSALSPHRLQLFRHRGRKVGIALLQPLGRLDHRKIMAEFFQRHAQLLDELRLLFERRKQRSHLRFADVGIGKHLRHLTAHLVAGGGLFFQDLDPVGQSVISFLRGQHAQRLPMWSTQGRPNGLARACRRVKFGAT
jgi:hypothetical protein